MSAAASRNSGSSRRWWKWAVLLAVLALVVVGVFWLRYDLRAYSVLTHYGNPQGSGLLLRLLTRNISVADVTLGAGDNSTAAYLYSPLSVAHPHGIVLVHGIHHLGIDDPRFINLARALAEDGFAVLTPKFDALVDYHVDGPTIPEIGESARWLEQRLGNGPVTLVGISFGGGLALVAAAEPQYEKSVRAVVSFGGYEDLARVSRFLVTSQEEFPDGRIEPMKAHDYGGAILVYDNLPLFFSPQDIAPAHMALRRYLWEEPETAGPWLAQLSPAGRATMDDLFARRIEPFRAKLLEFVQSDKKEMAALSPHGELAGLRVPVFLLHGSNDNVIPPAETLWLAKEVPARELRGVLITSVFTHVDLKDGASHVDELRLVHFMAGVLRAAD